MGEFEQVQRPLAAAKGLANAHYVDETTHDRECKELLFSNWAAIGFGKDIPSAGDAIPIDFAGQPIFALRDEKGEISVFQNTCRHRGMVLVREKGSIGRVIRCPYHSWCYAHSGELVTAPHIGGPGQNTHPEVDRSKLGLIRIPSYVWRDIIFVNILNNAPEFPVYASRLIERWGEFEQPLFHGGTRSSFKLDIRANWKLAVENYCESYHLPWVHPGLNSYSRLEDHYNIEEEGAFSGQGTLVYRQLKSEREEVFPDFAGLSDKWDEGAEYLALYPNVLLGVHRDHAFAIILQPLSVERTIEHVELYYAADISEAPAYSELIEKNSALWKTVFEEDIFVVEGMQAGRHGMLFDGGRFSPVMDGPTHCFHVWVAGQLSQASRSENG